MHAITTMPLNPRHAQKLGFYSLFVYARYLSKLHQLPTVFVLNEIGVKETCQSSDSLRKGLVFLESQPDILWSDEQVNEEMLEVLVKQLQDDGMVDEVMSDISHCECMKVQYLSHAFLRKTKTSLITKDGTTLCCRSPIKESVVRTLITRPLDTPKVYPELYPVWAKKEFDWIYSEMKGQQLLLSRMDDRRFLITTKSGNSFWLDNDVVGMFIPCLLQKDNVKIKHLISGISTMRQAALMTAWSLSLGIEPPEQIHFLPRVDFGPTTETDILQSVVKEFGPNRVINALLWCAMSERQTIVLDKNMFLRTPDKEVAPVFDKIKTRRSLLVR